MYSNNLFMYIQLFGSGGKVELLDEVVLSNPEVDLDQLKIT